MATEASQRSGFSANMGHASGTEVRNGRVVQAVPQPRRLAYFVSRFPVTTETFIVRELDEIARRPGTTAHIYSLFPAPPGARHDVANHWLPRARRSGLSRAARGLAWCLLHRPRSTVSSFCLIVADYWRRPFLLGRALIAFAASAAHVPEINGSADHVHAHFATYPALGAWLCGRLAGIPYSFTVHAHDLYVHQVGVRRRIDDAQFVVAISQHNRRMVEELGTTGTPVHVIHCGIDPSHYEFSPRIPPSEGQVRALCVASLEEKKGHRFLFEALSCGRPGLERIQLDLVGSGKLTEVLQEQAQRLGLAERVRFHGSLPEDQVAAMLGDADLFVLPSVVDSNRDMEGIPVALMEAMAAGVPVVSSRLSGIPELVHDGRTGLLADPGDAADLASVLQRTLQDPAACLARAQAARELVIRQFNLRTNAGRLSRALGATGRG